jgi:GlcNAc-P-P-Und epimerase
MRILVTGSSGYIGSRLVVRLEDAGHDVLGFDRVQPAAPQAKFVQGDLLDPSSYSMLLRQVDMVCHLAAAKGDWGISREEYFRDNVEATRALLAAANNLGIRHWMFYSTVSALGPSDFAVDETHPRQPKNAYGESKAICEELFEQFAMENSDANVVMIRPSVVFGPENPWNTNILRLIDNIHRNRFLMIGDGKQIKTTSYIDNLLDAHIFAMNRVAAGTSVFHYVDEPALSTAELVDHIYRCLGRSPSRLRLPLAVASKLAIVADAAAAISGVDLPITSARIRKFCTGTNFSAGAIRKLGYVQRVDIRQAIEVTVEWYLKSYAPKARQAG